VTAAALHLRMRLGKWAAVQAGQPDEAYWVDARADGFLHRPFTQEAAVIGPRPPQNPHSSTRTSTQHLRTLCNPLLHLPPISCRAVAAAPTSCSRGSPLVAGGCRGSCWTRSNRCSTQGASRCVMLCHIACVMWPLCLVHCLLRA